MCPLFLYENGSKGSVMERKENSIIFHRPDAFRKLDKDVVLLFQEKGLFSRILLWYNNKIF